MIGERASVGASPRIALALGGGSSRGLAHLVILEAFDELGLTPTVIAGTSFGAICGACYAAGMSAAEIRAAFEEQFASPSRFFRRFAGKLRGGFSALWSVRSPRVIDNVTLFEMLLPPALHNSFESLKIPFCAIAADLYAIEQVVLDHGPIIPALAASCALPGIARPVMLSGRVLVDGGYVNPVPYDVVMPRADITVAVDVTGHPQRKPHTRVPGTVETVTAATQLLFHSITREKLKSSQPDVFIRPNVGAFASFDYFRMRDILNAAQHAKDDLKRALAQRLEAAA